MKKFVKKKAATICINKHRYTVGNYNEKSNRLTINYLCYTSRQPAVIA